MEVEIIMNDKEMIEYLKKWNSDLEEFGDDEEEGIAVHNRCIKALETNERAITLLKACKELLNKQNESAYVLNLLETTVYYDEADCDGNCLLEDIDALLFEMDEDEEE